MMDALDALLELNTAMGRRMLDILVKLEEIRRLLKERQEPGGGTGQDQDPTRILHPASGHHDDAAAAPVRGSRSRVRVGGDTTTPPSCRQGGSPQPFPGAASSARRSS